MNNFYQFILKTSFIIIILSFWNSCNDEINSEFGLERDGSGNIITPFNLVEIDVNRESMIPSFGFSIEKVSPNSNASKL